MAKMRISGLAGIAFLCALAPASLFAESVFGPRGPEQGALRRQFWQLPSPERDVAMHTIVYRPPGRGPFWLVAINHDSTQSAERRLKLAMPTFESMAQFWVRRGYAVVIPQRPGHGETGGPYLEDQRGCEDADYGEAGRRTADSLAAAISFMAAQPFIRRDGIVVVGHSAGGFGALALAARNPPNMKAVINFGGGRGGRVNDWPNRNCAPDRLVAAAGEFGRTARQPTLWIYAQNDLYFDPALSRRMADAFGAAGGVVDYQLVPPFGDDGHGLIEAADGVAVWGPVVQRFLAHLK
jgi:dienelactone hydrolase